MMRWLRAVGNWFDARLKVRATLLPQRRDVWLLVQNHLKRDPATRAVIEWARGTFSDRTHLL